MSEIVIKKVKEETDATIVKLAEIFGMSKSCVRKYIKSLSILFHFLLLCSLLLFGLLSLVPTMLKA